MSCTWCAPAWYSAGSHATSRASRPCSARPRPAGAFPSRASARAARAAGYASPVPDGFRRTADGRTAEFHMLRFPRRVGARFVALLRADFAGVRAGFVALLISSGGDLVAGITLGSITGTLEQLPGLLVLVPAAIGMRGNVFGALGSRLGTRIHTGTFTLSRRIDTDVGQNMAAAIVSSLSISAVLAVLAKVMSETFGVGKTISIADFMVVSVVGAVLSSLLVLVLTVAVAAYCANRTLDLDNVAAPIVTAAGDMVTLPSLFLATYLLGFSVLTPLVAIV